MHTLKLLLQEFLTIFLVEIKKKARAAKNGFIGASKGQ